MCWCKVLDKWPQGTTYCLIVERFLRFRSSLVGTAIHDQVFGQRTDQLCMQLCIARQHCSPGHSCCKTQTSADHHATLLQQVYYIPRVPFYAQSTLPTLIGVFRLLRVIIIRERVTIVHAHQAFSALGGEALLHARAMGYKVGETACAY